MSLRHTINVATCLRRQSGVRHFYMQITPAMDGVNHCSRNDKINKFLLAQHVMRRLWIVGAGSG